MTEEANALWERARRALRTASQVAGEDPDTAASRAYYAAFYATSALFAARGKTFTKHTALHAAVHRDLVHTGEFPEEFGEWFRLVFEIRDLGDYGNMAHVSAAQAREAIEIASRILEAVSQRERELFPLGDTKQHH